MSDNTQKRSINVSQVEIGEGFDLMGYWDLWATGLYVSVSRVVLVLKT